jgi:hypothetical protein
LQRTIIHLGKARPKMPEPIKLSSKDNSKIGTYAAKQPLSGTNVITTVGVRGYNGTSFVRIEEIKKAV